MEGVSRHAYVFGLLVLVSLGLPAIGLRAAPFIRGDVDGNGVLEVTDTLNLLGFLFLGDPDDIGCGDRADTDDSGELDITDGIYILQFAFLGGRRPRPPYPRPGFDRTTRDPYQCGDVIGGSGRPVGVRVPSNHDPERPLPLVISLHGFGGNSTNHENNLKFGALVDEREFLLVTPDGTTNLNGSQFWKATDSCCNTQSSVDDSAYLKKVIDGTKRHYNVDPARVYVTGHSNGGFMSYRMACDHADAVAAIASLAGATWADDERCQPSSPVHILQIHGTADPTVRYQGGFLSGNRYPGAVESVEKWAGYNGCSPESEEGMVFDLDSFLSGAETLVDRYVTGCDAGGSSELWSIVGGSHSPSFLRIGDSSSFAVEVLDWFFAHPKAPLPRASFTVTPEDGAAPFEVTFDASASETSAESIVTYVWNFGDSTEVEGDGIQLHTFAEPGEYRVHLQVTDSAGLEDSTLRKVSVGFRDESVAPWTAQDIGDTSESGGTHAEGDCLAVLGALGRIGSREDGFRFVFQKAEGDFTFTAQVAGWTGSAGPTLGLMVRETLDPDSRHAVALVQKLRNGKMRNWFKYRDEKVPGISSERQEDLEPGPWLRVERQGDHIQGSISSDGLNWTEAGSTEILGLAGEVYVGIAATDRESAEARMWATATLCQLNLTALDEP